MPTDNPAPLSITLTDDELLELTRYSRPSDQLRALHKRGFSRAYLDRFGQVVLERAHFLAVCSGAVELPRPQVRMPQLRQVARKSA
jgi:hypothetical protein